MTQETAQITSQMLTELSKNYARWEKIKDLIDQLLDITLNYRQSGHPGGSRSKAPILITLLLSGVMRWDIRRPQKTFADRFILGAGHTVPLIYCTLALLNEALRVKYQQTGDQRFALHPSDKRVLYWQDLLNFRQRGGLSGHAEMEGKTLFLKFNTGPSGHGSAAAVGEALALKRAGAAQVKVFFLEGEGGLTPGVNYEAMNTAWGLALDNLYHIIDWNDFGIDEHPVSSSVYGTPIDWYAAHGWRVYGYAQGEDWEDMAKTFLTMTHQPNPEKQPSMACIKTRKGRGYLKYDNASHGVPHPINSDLFWETKRQFMEKYGVHFDNFGGKAPQEASALHAEFEANLKTVISVLHQDQELIDHIANTLVRIGESVPSSLDTFQLGNRSPFKDPRLYDYRNYPSDLYAQPGTHIANRAALAKWGAWVNAFGAREYGRPLFLACSADLAASTNINGFAEKYGGFPGYGWYERFGNPQGVLLPQEITEFVNAGLLAGMATVNFSSDPEQDFNGFWGVCSTYGSFAYLKYGMFRLFSQLAQDCQLKLGKILWIAGHSGPETAEDSRTHFGIFAPGVTQLFPQGQVINLHPWEHNEVPVLLAAALKTDIPIVALHLTRPPITIPDRQKLGLPSYFKAAHGAYILRDYQKGKPRGGTVIVQGTSAVANIIRLLPELERRQLNVKIVCAASAELFASQPEQYRSSVISPSDWIDSTVITTQARMLMQPWLYTKIAEEYALSADWDNRWRTGGSVEDVLDEAHLSPPWILKGIERFVRERPQRLTRLKAEISAAEQS